MVEPLAVLEDVEVEDVAERNRDQTLVADGGDKSKGEHHTTELGKHTARGIHHSAKCTLGPSSDHRETQQRSNDRAHHCRDGGQPERAEERAEDHWVKDPQQV